MNNNPENERYSRHYLLKGFGRTAQQKLGNARVLVVGAGGLGCPALQYLAAAGVGTIGIADDDVVSLSNLQRQVLFSTNDIGLQKAIVAADKLKQLNPEIIINVHALKASTVNAFSLLEAYDIVVDGTDNFAARYLINDACVLLKKPLVFGAIYQYEGQVAVFNINDESGRSTNYRHIFPQPPGENEAPDCATAGVLGVLPGIIGTMQATEVIKIITGIGKPLSNQLFTYNALNNQSYTLDIPYKALPEGLIPGDEKAFLEMDYEWLCGNRSFSAETIDNIAFQQKIKQPATIVIDVRETGEMPLAAFRNLSIPLSQLKEKADLIDSNEVVVFCQSGKRSLQAAGILTELFGNTKRIYSLRGGILGLPENMHTK